MIETQSLGQVGYRFRFGDTCIYVDPYLSNSVQEQEDHSMGRIRPIAIAPGNVDDADYVLVTHAHRDHCDPDTILPMADASPRCRIICPSNVSQQLIREGLPSERIQVITDNAIDLAPNLSVRTVPSAHPIVTNDPAGGWLCVGYILQYKEKRIYHAGDTFLTDELLDALHQYAPVDTAFLPVNEHNYARQKCNILGNMSVRDAFYLAEAIGARLLVPTHWDMFEMNLVYPEEIRLLYDLIGPKFELSIYPARI